MTDNSDSKKNDLQSENDQAGKHDPDEGHKKKIDRYSKAKTRSLLVSEHIINHYSEKLKFRQRLKAGYKVKDCGTYLYFHHFYTINEYRLIRSNFCKKHLHCALCAILRASKQLRAYLEKVQIILEENPGVKLALVTLTVKNGDDLLERYNHLKNNYRKMVQRRRNVLKGNSRTKTDTVFKHFLGAVTTTEFTNIGHGWHPHNHMIAIVDSDFDCVQAQKDLKKEWEGLTKDSHQCDIRMIEADDEKDLLSAFCEVFKYPLKMNDMSIEDQVFAGFELHKMRLIASFGLFFGVKVPEELEDSIEEDLQLLPYIDELWKYSSLFGYQLHESNIVLPEISK